MKSKVSKSGNGVIGRARATSQRHAPERAEAASQKMRMSASQASPYPRDFQGYGGNPPDPHWPAGARVGGPLMLDVRTR